MKTTTLSVAALDRSEVVEAHRPELTPDYVIGEALPTAANPGHVHS